MTDQKRTAATGAGKRENVLFRAAREAMPSRLTPGGCMSRAELAEAVSEYLWRNTTKYAPLDAHAIGRYERGEVRWPGAHYRDALRSVLNVAKDADLGFYPTPRGRSASGTESRSEAPIPARRNAGHDVTVPARMADGRVSFVSLPRRLLSGALSASAPSAVVSAVSRAGRGVMESVPIAELADMHPVERLEQMRRVIVDSDNMFGPEPVISTVTGHVELIRRLRQTVRGGDQSALMAMQSKYAELAGWLYQDYGDFAAADFWTNRALEWSHGSRDHDLTVFILARRAQLAGDMRDAAQAIDLGTAAREMARPGSRLAAVAVTYMAHGYALQGDVVGMQRGYDEARELLEVMQADPESPWGVWLDASYIEVARHRSLAMLGEYARAADGFEMAIAALPADYRRDRGVYLARAARAYAGAGDADRAAALGLQALPVGLQTRSGRILTELVELGDTFDGRHSAGIADFLDAIAETIGQVINPTTDFVTS